MSIEEDARFDTFCNLTEFVFVIFPISIYERNSFLHNFTLCLGFHHTMPMSTWTNKLCRVNPRTIKLAIMESIKFFPITYDVSIRPCTWIKVTSKSAWTLTHSFWFSIIAKDRYALTQRSRFPEEGCTWKFDNSRRSHNAIIFIIFIRRKTTFHGDKVFWEQVKHKSYIQRIRLC